MRARDHHVRARLRVVTGDHSDLALLCEPVARIVWGKPSSETASELRWGTHGSRVVNREKGVWHDHERGIGGGTLDLVPGVTKNDRLQWLRDRSLLGPARGGPRKHRNGGADPFTIVATYEYTDESGVPLFQVVRLAPKDFRQRRPNGKGGWTWSLGDTRRVVYRLPEVRDAAANGRLVFVVEGEKDTDNLRKLGLTATCNPGGANKWRAEYNESLRGADVVIIGHNDDSGRAHVAHVACSLQAVVRRVRVLDLSKAWPTCPAKGDISDWIEAGGTAENLAALIEMHGTQSETIEPARLLTQIYDFIGRFVAYPSDHAHVAHALWIAHTHFMDAWESTPRIVFLSPEPESGKTRALEVTELLVPNAVEAINVTPAYLFRKVGDENGRPTILYDEIDTVFGPRAKQNEEIRGLLNAGHRRGAVAGRCVVRGKIIETEEISAYCAVALAGLGWLPDTILTRSIVVRMRRRGPHEAVEPFRRRVHAQEGHTLRGRLTAWATGIVKEMTEARPAIPAGIEDRSADVWEPLFAIADAAGRIWGKRARDAAVALVAAFRGKQASLGVQLLQDLRIVFGNGRDRMTTKEILTALCALPEAPWSDLKGKPLNARGLAKRLEQYGISSRTIRIGDTTPKGYERADLADAWARYLSPTSAGKSATSATNDGIVPENVADGEPSVAGSHLGSRTNAISDLPDVADVADVADLPSHGCGTFEDDDTRDFERLIQ
jgi:hypothetical protein